MVKALITLPNGTEITIDGTPEEVQSLLDHYGRPNDKGPEKTLQKKSQPKKKRTARSSESNSTASGGTVDLAEIVNLVKNCDEAEAIETEVLDRTSQVDRVLLPMYIVHEHLDNAFGLSSGDIATITRELSVPISQANVSHTLSGTAAKYVMGDGVRKKGAKLTYKLSRRGLTYIKGVIGGKSDEK